MTTKQTATITALRAEALDHDDAKCVALCDAALAGDVDAARRLGVIVKAVAMRAKERAPVKTALERKMERIEAARDRDGADAEDLGVR